MTTLALAVALCGHALTLTAAVADLLHRRRQWRDAGEWLPFAELYPE